MHHWGVMRSVVHLNGFIPLAQKSRWASENRVAVGFPVTCLLQILLDAHLLRSLDDFIRGALLPREEFAAHLHHGGSIQVLELAAALDEGVPEEEGPDLSLFWFIRGVSSDTSTHSALEQLDGLFRGFPRWWNCRSSLFGISANGASPGRKRKRFRPLLAVVVMATRCHTVLFMFSDECSPNDAISNSKIPKDQLEGDKTSLSLEAKSNKIMVCKH